MLSALDVPLAEFAIELQPIKRWESTATKDQRRDPLSDRMQYCHNESAHESDEHVQRELGERLLSERCVRYVHVQDELAGADEAMDALSLKLGLIARAIETTTTT